MALTDEAPFRSLIRESAAVQSHSRSALVDAYHECRYPEIVAHLDLLQEYLRQKGARPGDCIAVELNNSVRAALVAMSILDAGYSVVALPVSGQGARGNGNELPIAGFSRISARVRSDKAATKVGLADPASYLDVGTNPDFNPRAATLQTGEARLFFRTSGSLGSPKLAVHTQQRFRNNVLNAKSAMNMKHTDRIALPTPIFHLYGLGVGFLGGLAAGASIDFQERGNLLRYLEREEDFNPNIAFVTPSFCEALVKGRRSSRRYDLMITSGDRISESTFRRSEQVHGPMVNSYGCTEMGSLAVGNLAMESEHRCRSVGRTYAGVEYRVVPLAIDEVKEPDTGELQIKYGSGFIGYVDHAGNAMTPANAFDGDWYRTGDLARLGADESIEILGRCDLSINRNGVLLPFADVENRLREIEGVEEVAVVAGPEGLRGRDLVAFCTLAVGTRLTEQDFRTLCIRKMPAYAVPDIVRLVAALPKLQSGKIDRQALASELGALH